MQENTLKKIKLVQDMVKRYYEPGRQDRCLRWVWLNHVNKIYPMSERTFYRYCRVRFDPTTDSALSDSGEGESDGRQMRLWK